MTDSSLYDTSRRYYDGSDPVRYKALSRGAIFLATCNAILLLGDVKMANTSFYHSLLICSKHIKHSSLIYIS